MLLPRYSERAQLDASRLRRSCRENETCNDGKTQWFPLIRTLREQHGSVPAAVAAVSRGPILVEWLSINLCDFCTHARIDVGIATSDSMALRDLPHDFVLRPIGDRGHHLADN